MKTRDLFSMKILPNTNMRSIPMIIQQYPLGTQEKYNSFQSRNPVMKDGVITERQGGGLEIRISDEGKARGSPYDN